MRTHLKALRPHTRAVAFLMKVISPMVLMPARNSAKSLP